MRVIAGVARGHKLLAPKGMRVRPTADRVKEALFSSLSSRLGNFSGLRVLDIFAGTGNLGIEALSRGAAFAVFVDAHRDSAQLVKQNLQQTGFQEKAQVVQQDAVAAVRTLARTEAAFDLIFLDPPYREGLAEKVLEQLATSALVNEESLVVAEYGKSETMPAAFGKLQQTDKRIYGDTAISFYAMVSEEESHPASPPEEEHT